MSSDKSKDVMVEIEGAETRGEAGQLSGECIRNYHEVGTYQVQFDRLLRSYKRLKEVSEGRTHSRDSDHYTDDMYAFFMNCHHLKDWLRHDDYFPSGRTEIEKFITDNRALRLCADICNAQKHLRLTDPRSGENPTLGSRINEVWLGGGGHKVIVKFTIDTKNGPLDAFVLASECLELWTQFIKENNTRVEHKLQRDNN